MDKAILLILAHYLGDNAFQPDWMVTNKKKYKNILLSHAIVWSTPISLVLMYFGAFSAVKLVFLVVGHYLIDLWNIKQAKECLGDNWYVVADQALHLLQLVIVYI